MCLVSCIVYRVSCVVCRVSRVMCRVLRVVCRVSCVVCRVSCVVCRVPCVVCRTLPPASSHDGRRPRAKGSIVNTDFVATDSADLGETRHGPAISLNYVEVTILARDDLMSILAAFPETAEAVARAAMFYKARAAVLRWAARRAAVDDADGDRRDSKPQAFIEARRHSGVVRPPFSPVSASVGECRAYSTPSAIGASDQKIARSMDQTPIARRLMNQTPILPRAMIPQGLSHPPPQPRSLSALREGSAGAGVTWCAAERFAAPHQPSQSGTDGASDDLSGTSTNDRQLGALRDQISALETTCAARFGSLEATCAARFGSLEATCAARFGSLEAVLVRLDRRMSQTSYDCEREADASETR